MKKKTTWLVLGGVAAVLLTAGYIVYVRWMVDFVLNWSSDLVMNSLHLLGVSMTLAAASVLEGLIVREIWHTVKSMTAKEEEIDLDAFDEHPGSRSRALRDKTKLKVQRQIRETWTVWLVFIGLPIAVNVLVMNAASGGYVLSGQGGLTRYATVATMLRSSDPEVLAQGVDESVGLTEKKLGRYLARIIAGRGELADEAAWAAATRGDEDTVVPLRWMFLKGDEEQRRWAIVSLARLGDRRGAYLAMRALEEGEDPRMECIVALGLTAYEPAETYLIDLSAESNEPDVVRAAAMWAVTEIEKGRFERAYHAQKGPDLTAKTMVVPPRRGFEPMLEALEGDSEVLRCAAIQGLRYAGPVDVAEVLMREFEKADHLEKCQSLSLEHHESTRFELVRFGLTRSLIIDSLAGVGNRTIASWLEKQAEDRKNADEVILKVRDLARQIRHLR